MEENESVAPTRNDLSDKLPDSNGLIKFVIGIVLSVAGPVVLYFNIPFFAMAMSGEQAYVINIFGSVIGIALSVVGVVMILYSFLAVLLSIDELLWIIADKYE